MLEGLKTYLLDTLDIEAEPAPWDGSGKLPLFLNDLYTFGTMVLFDRSYILAFPDDRQEYTPGAVEKHFARIRELTNIDVVYVSDTLAGWNRKRYIEKKISFIIPGTQMYLPLLGVDLREYVRLPSRKTNGTRLSQSTQEISLFVLGYKKKNKWTGAELTKERAMSLMTVHRAFDELETIGGFSIQKDGKRRLLTVRENRSQTWEALLPVVINPCSRTLVIPRKFLPSCALVAGLTALAIHSDIAAPEIPEFAVRMTTWNKYTKKKKVTTLPSAEPGAVRVQLWRYEPKFEMDSNEADILSVILTLQGFDDERVAQAIKQALKESLC